MKMVAVWLFKTVLHNTETYGGSRLAWDTRYTLWGAGQIGEEKKSLSKSSSFRKKDNLGKEAKGNGGRLYSMQADLWSG